MSIWSFLWMQKRPNTTTTRERRLSEQILKVANRSFDLDEKGEPLLSCENDDGDDHHHGEKQDPDERKDRRGMMARLQCMSSTRLTVLVILCLQNSMFTVLRRYSQGILKETYSKYEVLLVGEVIKMGFSAYMISKALESNNSSSGIGKDNTSLYKHIMFVISHSRKMVVLALIYGAMNILSFVSLRNIGAGTFTIFAQCKILTTATCSTIILGRKYSWTQWRALTALMLGVLLFSEHIWGNSANLLSNHEDANPFVGVLAVVIEVTLSGFASIYFEKVIKTDPQKMSIWERNFQLALGSFPVYIVFMANEALNRSPDDPGMGSGWSFVAWILVLLGAAGGLLVALSIKYGDSILKTLATTGAIVLSAVLDHYLLGGPLTPTMMIAGAQVIIAICNYTFDTTPPQQAENVITTKGSSGSDHTGGPATDVDDLVKDSERSTPPSKATPRTPKRLNAATGGNSSNTSSDMDDVIVDVEVNSLVTKDAADRSPLLQRQQSDN